MSFCGANVILKVLRRLLFFQPGRAGTAQGQEGTAKAAGVVGEADDVDGDAVEDEAAAAG